MATNATAAKPETPKAAAAPAATPLEEKQALQAHNRMRDYFAAQPKVSIKTREDEWVQVNDYTFIIKKGERVDVPKDIADLLEESGRI